MTKSNSPLQNALKSAEERCRNKTVDVATSFLECLNTPISLSLSLLLKYGEHEQIRTFEVLPSNYNSPEQFRDDFLASKFLSKSTFLNKQRSRSTKEVALEKFFDCERKNMETNNRFNNPSFDPLLTAANSSSFHLMKRKIQQIMGDIEPTELFAFAGWGPGVSTFIKGDKLGAPTKFHDECGITQQWYDFVYPLMLHCTPMWVTHIESHRGWNITEYSQLMTVPKNSKTDRVIGVEPGINLFFQKAIGKMLRRKLKTVRIDLKKQQDLHKVLARSSSQDDNLATVDFSSASDMISSALVRELLDLDWYLLLDACRTKGVVLDGKRHLNHKFSSMGNGFTFELESLIFYSAACAVVPENLHSKISVFGDDVILPSKYYQSFVDFCDFLGFQVNTKKSYSSTYFRESCGSYYFNGLDCKPIYLKDNLHDIKSLYKMANNIRRVAHRRNCYYGCDLRLLPSWFKIVNSIPNSLKLFGPDGYGDDFLIGNEKQYSPFKKTSLRAETWDGSEFISIRSTPLKYHVGGTGLLLARLWSICDRSNELFGDEGMEPPFRPLPNTDLPLEKGNQEHLKSAIKLERKPMFIPHPLYCVGEWV